VAILLAGRREDSRKQYWPFFKKLAVEIQGKETVFPGQQDTISIQVTDYKNRPAAHVNLTAVSYNNQVRRQNQSASIAQSGKVSHQVYVY